MKINRKKLDEIMFFVATCVQSAIFFVPILCIVLDFTKYPMYINVILILFYAVISIHGNWKLTKIFNRKEEFEKFLEKIGYE